VPQAQIGAIQAGGHARVEIPSVGKWIDAKRVTIVPSADPRTHTTQVRLELPPDVRGVYPGIYALAHFIIGREPRLLVPRAAVIRRSEVVGAYVLGADGFPQLRQIRLGAASDETSVEVLAGLRAGDRVALEPLKAAAEARPRAAD
jgi:hypothetical protein